MAGYRGNYQGAGKDTTVEATPVSVPALPDDTVGKPAERAERPSQRPSTRRQSSANRDARRQSGTRTDARPVKRSAGGGNNTALLMLGVVVVLAILAFLLFGEGGVSFERTISK